MTALAPATAPPRRTDLPAQIGKYVVRAKLGEGATSEVFLAHDEFHQRDVAIKRVRRGLALDTPEGHFQQHFFAAEAALVGRLQHPNVVQIYDAVEDAEATYLVMEYVDGVTLRRFCRADALLSLEQVVEIGFKCAKALGYVYRQGLIHRDVKPANILATLNNGLVTDVKITDFGSVMNLQSERTQVFRVGSLAYMPPEQLEGDVLDARADIYALAGVLYHLIAGRAPFDATQQAALMHQIYHAQPGSLQPLRDGVPPRLDALILRALSKRREDRHADWDSFAQELSALVAEGDVPRGPLQGVLDSERFNLLRSLEFFGGFGDVELWEVVHRAQWQRCAFGHALYKARASKATASTSSRRARSTCTATASAWPSSAPAPRSARWPTWRPAPRCACTAPTWSSPSPPPRSRSRPQLLEQLSLGTRRLFDTAFIRVLVRRLHAAHEALAHPRRIL